MAGEINYGILNQNIPAQVANSFYQGQQNALADAQAIRANKLADIQLRNAEQEQTDRNALRGLNSAAPDYTQQVARINPKLGMELSKMQMEQRTAKLNQAKTTLELMGNAATSVMANPTPEYAKAVLAKFGQDTGVDVTGEMAQIDAMQGNPDAIKQWAAGHALKAADLLPKFQHFDQGAAVVTGSVDPITGKFVQGQAYQKAVSPDAMLSAETARRGQNMTDARAREQLQAGKVPAGFRYTADGNLERIPGGPADLKAQHDAELRASGGADVDIAISTLRDAYDRLEAGGGITSTKQSALSNAPAYFASTGAGQATGKMFGTQNQSARNEIAMTRPALLAALMKATGMSSKQMDSNAELKLWLSTATDPTLDVEANRKALDNIERKYLKNGPTTAAGGAAPTIKTDADYSALPSGTEFIAPDGSRRRKP